MEYTENLKLFKYNPETDGKQVFSIDQALNYNWDILDKFSGFDIGDPIISLTGTLKENEIWLEGAEVSKTDYNLLYEIYQDIYGTPTDINNFVLPDFRGRTFWGSEDGTFGLLSAGLPNITGYVQGSPGYMDGWLSKFHVYVDGCFNQSYLAQCTYQATNAATFNSVLKYLNFDASDSNSIYGNSDTVQTPSIKVRVKTRYR